MPWGDEYPSLVRVDLPDGNRMLAVNPYSGEILRDVPQAGTWNEFMTNVHGELLIGGNGGPGDFVIEIAASLGVIMVATGLYLWWPRNGRSLGTALSPQLNLQGRALWKSLHESSGCLDVDCPAVLPAFGTCLGRRLGWQVRTGLEHISC